MLFTLLSGANDVLGDEGSSLGRSHSGYDEPMLRRGTAALLGLASCGRIGFDATGGDASVSAADGSDAAQTACNVATPSLVQLSCATNTASGVTAALPASITAGNVLFVVVNIDSTSANATVTDSAGNTMQRGMTARSATSTVMLFAASITNAGLDELTVTLDDVAGFTAIFAHEVTGVRAVAESISQSGVGTAATTPPLSTSVANTLLFGSVVSSDRVTSVGPGFTSLQGCAGDRTAYALAATPGSYAATYTIGMATDWLATLTAFSPCI